MAETLYSINKRLNAVERAVERMSESDSDVASFAASPAVRVAQSGETVTFSVDPVGDSLTFQWQYIAPNGTKWANTTLTGNKTNTLTVSATSGRNGYQYRCVVSYGSSSITSTPGRLVVLS